MEQRTEPVGYVEPSINDFLRILIENNSELSLTRGGGLKDIIVYTPHKRGAGFLSFVRKSLLPFIKPHLFSLGSNILSDMSQGSKLTDSIKRRGLETMSEIGHRVARGGARRKRKSKTIKRKNKKIKRKCKRLRKTDKMDIFKDL